MGRRTKKAIEEQKLREAQEIIDKRKAEEKALPQNIKLTDQNLNKALEEMEHEPEGQVGKYIPTKTFADFNDLPKLKYYVYRLADNHKDRTLIEIHEGSYSDEEFIDRWGGGYYEIKPHAKGKFQGMMVLNLDPLVYPPKLDEMRAKKIEEQLKAGQGQFMAGIGQLGNIGDMGMRIMQAVDQKLAQLENKWTNNMDRIIGKLDGLANVGNQNQTTLPEVIKAVAQLQQLSAVNQPAPRTDEDKAFSVLNLFERLEGIRQKAEDNARESASSSIEQKLTELQTKLEEMEKAKAAQPQQDGMAAWMPLIGQLLAPIAGKFLSGLGESTPAIPTPQIQPQIVQQPQQIQQQQRLQIHQPPQNGTAQNSVFNLLNKNNPSPNANMDELDKVISNLPPQLQVMAKAMPREQLLNLVNQFKAKKEQEQQSMSGFSEVGNEPSTGEDLSGTEEDEIMSGVV